MPRHRDSGRPLAYGFVEFTSRVDAWTAIQKVDGRQMDAEGLRVNVSWSKESKPPGEGGRLGPSWVSGGGGILRDADSPQFLPSTLMPVKSGRVCD